MSFRIEEKILVSENHKFLLREYLSTKNAKMIYKPRQILSLYFDNNNFEMFKDSEEGIVPRKKIRIRTYPKSNENYALEEKISSIEGRFKTVKMINKKDFEKFTKNGIFDVKYGHCKPKIFVKYNREYLSIGSTRLTIDTNITFLNLSKKTIGKEHNSVLELKTNYKRPKEDLMLEFPFMRTRFSKYCMGLINSKF